MGRTSTKRKGDPPGRGDEAIIPPRSVKAPIVSQQHLERYHVAKPRLVVRAGRSTKRMGDFACGELLGQQTVGVMVRDTSTGFDVEEVPFDVTISAKGFANHLRYAYR